MTRHEPAATPARATNSGTPVEERAVVIPAGPTGPGELAALCAHVERLLAEHDVQLIVCDVERHPEADLRIVQTLTRLALTAKRRGRRIRVRHASRNVRDLLSLAGLADVLPCEDVPGPR